MFSTMQPERGDTMDDMDDQDGSEYAWEEFDPGQLEEELE